MLPIMATINIYIIIIFISIANVLHGEIVQIDAKILWRYWIKDIVKKNRNSDDESISKTDNQKKNNSGRPQVAKTY